MSLVDASTFSDECFPFIPANYTRRWDGIVDTANSIDWKNTIESRVHKIYSISPLFKILVNDTEYTLSKPICLNISNNSSYYIAENDNLSVFGTGKSVEEAIDDFNQHIVYFYNYYKNISEDKLIGKALTLKRVYKELFARIEYAN